MGILYITEYAQLAPAGAPGGRGPLEPPLAEQKVTYSTSTQSAPFNAKTRMVRIHTDSNHGVPVGAGYMVAAITNT